jgi:1,4-dihydroxy-2-naphthoate polyprenyltransferase
MIRLKINDPKTQEILNSLQWQSKLAVPKEIIQDEIIFELKENDIQKPNLIKRWFFSLRALSLTVMFMPCLAVLLMQDISPVSWFRAISLLLVPGLLLLAVNVLNDVEDHMRMIDLPGTLGGSGVIQKGWIKPRELRYFALTLIIIAAALALPVIIEQPTFMLSVLLITLMVVLGYSGKPFDFKYRALGDVAVYLTCGPLLTIAYSQAVFNSFNAGTFWLGSAFGFAAVAILHANNMTDIPTDQARGANTVAIKLGFAGSQKFMLLTYSLWAISLLLLTLKNQITWIQLIPQLISLLLILKLMVRIFKAREPHDPSIADLRMVTPQIHLIMGVILCLSLRLI